MQELSFYGILDGDDNHRSRSSEKCPRKVNEKTFGKQNKGWKQEKEEGKERTCEVRLIKEARKEWKNTSKQRRRKRLRKCGRQDGEARTMGTRGKGAEERKHGRKTKRDN